MKTYLYLIVLALVLTSCGSNEEADKKPDAVAQPPLPTGPSVAEQAGIKEITDFYGGECKFAVSKPGDAKRYVELQITKSPSLDTSQHIAALCAGNIALLYYKHVAGTPLGYDELHTIIFYPDGQKAEKDFGLKQLDTVLTKSKLVDDLVACVKAKNFDGLQPLLNDQNGIVANNKKDLIEKMKGIDPQLGALKQFLPFGFIFYNSDKGKELLHISGMMIREKNNNQFSIDIDPADAKEEAVVINYKL